MRVQIDQEGIYELALQLKQISAEIEEMNRLFQTEISVDDHFTGDMASTYQHYLQELYKEHQKMIHFYQDFYKQLNEIVKDYEELEEVVLSRIENL